jgi:hypothetical protein
LKWLALRFLCVRAQIGKAEFQVISPLKSLDMSEKTSEYHLEVFEPTLLTLYGLLTDSQVMKLKIGRELI